MKERKKRRKKLGRLMKRIRGTSELTAQMLLHGWAFAWK